VVLFTAEAIGDFVEGRSNKTEPAPMNHQAAGRKMAGPRPIKKGGDNVVHAIGFVFSYEGRYRDHCGTYQGKPIAASMVRRARSRALRKSGLDGLQMRDLRHTWKTNAQRSCMDPTTTNRIVGRSSQRSVEDRYIRVSDEELLKAVDSMRFDNGWTELDLVEEA